MEIGSIADWIGVGIAIIALVISIRADWERIRNIPPQVARIMRAASTVLFIVLVAVFAFRLGSSYEAGENVDADFAAIEDWPGEFFSYSHDAYGGLNVVRKLDGDLDYRFSYDVASGAESYAGIYFYFSPTRDLTEYAALQVTMSFSDDNAICELYLQDQQEKQSYITLGNSRFDNASDDARMERQGSNRVFTIPLNNNFMVSIDASEFNKQSTAGLGFGVNGSKISGLHSCTIQDILFLKE